MLCPTSGSFVQLTTLKLHTFRLYAQKHLFDDNPKAPLKTFKFSVSDVTRGSHKYSLNYLTRKNEQAWLFFDFTVQQRVSALVKVLSMKYHFENAELQRSLKYRFETAVDSKGSQSENKTPRF